jgi:hypothetical protein
MFREVGGSFFHRKSKQAGRSNPPLAAKSNPADFLVEYSGAFRVVSFLPRPCPFPFRGHRREPETGKERLAGRWKSFVPASIQPKETGMRDVVKKQVDEIVAAIDGGKKAEDFADAAKWTPYVFIMEDGGNLLVHPTLAGQSLKEKAPPVFDQVAKGTPDGAFVNYEWAGAMKCTYSRKTASGLFVGSGFDE